MSKSSQQWLKAHAGDEYVLRARKQGYRSRAVYKLMELDEKYRLFKPGDTVVDLGASPGGWTQYAGQRVGDRGLVLATDILPMDAIAGIRFIQGDFREADVEQAILQALNARSVDLVISDMAPNISGMEAVDIPRSLYLVELAQDFSNKVLKIGGTFLCKLFQGSGTDQWLNELRSQYKKVVVRKPKASRPKSREVYVIALEKNDRKLNTYRD